jgi:hypothetical protein
MNDDARREEVEREYAPLKSSSPPGMLTSVTSTDKLPGQKIFREKWAKLE